MNDKQIKAQLKTDRRGALHTMEGAGLLEVLITLTLTSAVLVGLLRMHASVMAFEHEQKMMTTAGFFEQDLNESIYLLHDAAVIDSPTAAQTSHDEILANWQNRVTNNDSALATAIERSEHKIRVEIAWSSHPILTANERCTLNTSCLVMDLVP